MPIAMPVASATAAGRASFDIPAAEGPFVQTRFRRRRWTRRRYAALGVGLLLGIGVVFGVAKVIQSSLKVSDGSFLSDKGRVILFNLRNQKNEEEKAFKLVLPDKAWLADNEMRQRMGVTTVWKSADKDKDAWFAVYARDYGLTRPREAELLRSGIERLEQLFEGSLELAEKAEPARIGSDQGQKLLFKAQRNSVIWWGHMYMLAHQGIGYWLYVAAPSKQEAEDLFARDLQGPDVGFLVSTDRKGCASSPPRWRRSPPATEH